MNRRIPRSVAAATAAVALCMLGAAACSAAPQTSAAPKVVSMDASWAEYYKSMSALKAHTDVAVEGTITKATFDPRASATATPFTDFQFTVESTYFDPHSRIAATASKPAVLTIHQTGGTVNGTTYQVDDDPLFQIGQKYVLFLREYSPGHYTVVGGPTGRFAVAASGAVTPIVSNGVKFTGTLPAMNQAIKTS